MQKRYFLDFSLEIFKLALKKIQADILIDYTFTISKILLKLSLLLKLFKDCTVTLSLLPGSRAFDKIHLLKRSLFHSSWT